MSDEEDKEEIKLAGWCLPWHTWSMWKHLSDETIHLNVDGKEKFRTRKSVQVRRCQKCGLQQQRDL